MSKKYYYFCASLPSLSFGDKPPMTYDKFLEDAKDLLDPDHFSAVQAILTDNTMEVKSRVYDRWRRFEHDLYNQLAWLRSKEAGKPPMQYVRGDFNVRGDIILIVEQAMRETNPLKTAQFFDKARWWVLDELGKRHYFDYDFIVTYAIKLRILYRYEAIRSDEGEQKFNAFKDEDLVSQALAAERI